MPSPACFSWRQKNFSVPVTNGGPAQAVASQSVTSGLQCGHGSLQSRDGRQHVTGLQL